MSGAHVLYRFYSKGGQLLYIGITMDPPKRFRSHRDAKEWWSEVAGITVENYADREELAAAERRAIKVERPVHNVVHNAGGTPKPLQHNKISYYCAACGKRVTAGTGYVHVSYEDMRRVQDAWRDLKIKKVTNGEVFAPDGHADLLTPGIAPQAAERLRGAADVLDGCFVYSGGELRGLPDPAAWSVHHTDCDPAPDGCDYHFDVGRADTFEALLSWTAHLLEKRWIQDTNWSEFLYSQLSEKAKCV